MQIRVMINLVTQTAGTKNLTVLSLEDPAAPVRREALRAARLVPHRRVTPQLGSRLGHPVVGDRLYGSRCPAERPLLHASTIALPHPATGEPLRVVAPMPDDLARWWG